nr:hypothetical protein [Halorubrum sp. Atlit-28R]
MLLRIAFVRFDAPVKVVLEGDDREFVGVGVRAEEIVRIVEVKESDAVALAHRNQRTGVVGEVSSFIEQ